MNFASAFQGFRITLLTLKLSYKGNQTEYHREPNGNRFATKINVDS